jgi:hypothetical protein
MSYVPGSDQSRIFVTSSSEFSSLNAREIQSVLRERLILVHGNPSDYKYGWDLESFGRVYDVDKKITVHGKIYMLCETSLLKTMFSFNTFQSPTPKLPSPPRNIAAISRDNDHSIE